MDRSHLIRVAPASTPTLVREWLLTRRAFEAFQHLPPGDRPTHLGKLFERLSPWIQRGIRVATMRHFLVLPEEMLLARLFALSSRGVIWADPRPMIASGRILPAPPRSQLCPNARGEE